MKSLMIAGALLIATSAQAIQFNQDGTVIDEAQYLSVTIRVPGGEPYTVTDEDNPYLSLESCVSAGLSAADIFKGRHLKGSTFTFACGAVAIHEFLNEKGAEFATMASELRNARLEISRLKKGLNDLTAKSALRR